MYLLGKWQNALLKVVICFDLSVLSITKIMTMTNRLQLWNQYLILFTFLSVCSLNLYGVELLQLWNQYLILFTFLSVCSLNLHGIELLQLWNQYLILFTFLSVCSLNLYGVELLQLSNQYLILFPFLSICSLDLFGVELLQYYETSTWYSSPSWASALLTSLALNYSNIMKPVPDTLPLPERLLS